MPAPFALPPDEFPDSTNADTPRDRFRLFLTSRVTTADALAWYVDEALAASAQRPDAQDAVAELIDQAGRLLGFGVTWHAARGCSQWLSPAHHELLVRAVAPGAAAQEVAALARLRDGARMDVPSRTVSGLGVVCGDARAVPATDPVVLRRAADAARLVSLQALVALTRANAAGTLGHADALALLKPASVLADDDIAIATRGGDAG